MCIGGDASKSSPKKAKKIYKMLTLTSSKSSLKNAMKAGFFSTVIVMGGRGDLTSIRGVCLAKIEF